MITTNISSAMKETVKFRKASFLASFLAACVVSSGCDGVRQTKGSSKLPAKQSTKTSSTSSGDSSGGDSGGGDSGGGDSGGGSNNPGMPTSPRMETYQPSPSDPIIGSWVMGLPCNVIPTKSGGSTEDVFTFSADGTFSIESTVFSDKMCTDAMVKTESSGPYTVGGSHGEGQVINLDFAQQIMRFHKSENNSLASLCSRSVGVNEPFSVKKGECTATDSFFVIRYSIFKVAGNELHMGLDALAEKDRPLTLSTYPIKIGTRKAASNDDTD